jgi:hypothetical protein
MLLRGSEVVAMTRLVLVLALAVGGATAASGCVGTYAYTTDAYYDGRYPYPYDGYYAYPYYYRGYPYDYRAYPYDYRGRPYYYCDGRYYRYPTGYYHGGRYYRYPGQYYRYTRPPAGGYHARPAPTYRGGDDRGSARYRGTPGRVTPRSGPPPSAPRGASPRGHRR